MVGLILQPHIHIVDGRNQSDVRKRLGKVAQRPFHVRQRRYKWNDLAKTHSPALEISSLKSPRWLEYPVLCKGQTRCLEHDGRSYP